MKFLMKFLFGILFILVLILSLSIREGFDGVNEYAGKGATDIATRFSTLATMSQNGNKALHGEPCKATEMGIFDGNKIVCYPYTYTFKKPNADYHIFETPNEAYKTQVR